MPRKKSYSFFIAPDLDVGLKVLKARDGVPEGESIRRALAEYLRKKGALMAAKPTRGRTSR